MPVKYEQKTTNQSKNKAKHYILCAPVGENRQLEKWAGLPLKISEKTKRPHSISEKTKRQNAISVQ